MKRFWVVAAWLCFLASTVMAGEVGFIEDFSLAKDRASSLLQLVPGTEDYYYFQCLHFLNTEQFDKAESLTRPWLERFGQTARLTEIQTRHALLTYDRNPTRTLTYLKDRLGLRFDQQRMELGAPPTLPTALDPQLISRATLLASSFARWRNLDNFEDSALDWLAGEKLSPEQRRNLLQRLQRPDVANLPQLVADDLATTNSPAFGAFAIHRQMTQAQLDELLRLRPTLLNHAAFVQFQVMKLQPNADENWQHDHKFLRAYLDRLLAFTRRLEPVHNNLKAHVLYHRLALDRTQGQYDRALFIEYLKLPRRVPYLSRALAESLEGRQYPADLGADFTGVTLLPPVRNDEPLVRAYLMQFLLSADSPREFEPYVNDVYLRHLFAETKIVNGLGEPEQWAALLPPEAFQRLRERVDIDVDATNKTNFGAEEPVRLDLHVKNVPTLIVKIFEINTVNFYRQNLREVNTDVNLDGLIANVEQTHRYSEPPLRRMARRFEFPQLQRPGVYVIDFIGGGVSSRALIRKGKLHPLVSNAASGQRVTVVDDAQRQVKDATLWLGGRDFRAEEDGTILVPYSTNPGRTPIVLSRGDFACLDYLDHQPERYELQAGIHVDREALLAQRVAAVLVRPGLYLNGTPTSIRLLEDVKLRITATDRDGIATTSEVGEFKLFEDRESTHEFRVPPRLATIQFTLEAKVKSLSLNTKVDLSAAQSFTLNGIEATERIEDLHLAKFGQEYVVELLGRTGEAKPDRPVQLAIKQRDFREPVHVTLKTDRQGRVRLGALTDVVSLRATGPEGAAHTWTLATDAHTYRQAIHARAGEVISLPYLGNADHPVREELALFAMRGDVIQADRFDALAIQNGMLELRGLAPGDYDLWLKQPGERIRIRVAEGTVLGNYVLGKKRQLQLPLLKPVQIAALAADAENLIIRTYDASQFTRVHVIATRYQPEFSAFTDLGRVRDAGLEWIHPSQAESTYVIGRNIGDEFRYVLDRRGQKKFPGNMMDRPALLLNPWAVRSTETGEQLPQAGEEFRRRAEPPASEHGRAPNVAALKEKASAPDVTPNLDFLAEASAVISNLVPDKDGVIKVSRKELGSHSMIHVIALDPLNTTYRSITVAEQPAKFLDLRLADGLDPNGHFTQKKQVSILRANQSFTLADAASSRFEPYDSLARVFGLFTTLTNDPKLMEFSFILNWPTLKPEEKRSHYSKYACHELNFFLLKKDPDFFRAVVKPYLANKKDKTFLDHWLLENELAEFERPWQYGRLNVPERIWLAQRIQGEPAKTARHLGDLLRLLPPDPAKAERLFATAIQGSELTRDNALRLKTATRELERLEDEQREEKARKPADQPPAPGAPAGGPGAAPSRAGGAGGGRGQQGTGYPGAPAAGLGGLRRDGGQADKKAEAKDANAHFLEDQDARYALPFDRAAGKPAQQLYRRLDPTQEWAENNYYKLPIQKQLADLVTVNAFWLDYANHDGKTPFLSPKFTEASRNFTEMMLALAVLDLPFTAGKPDVKFEGAKMTYVPSGPVIAFHEEVKPVAPAATKVNVLVSQDFYRHGDRFREEAGEKIDKFITEEFVIQTVYGCQVVVTNPTSSRQRLSVLLQTPVGSIPLANGRFTRTVLLDLEPYRTQTIDYLFYFPLPGRFAHFPVHVAKNEELVASAKPFTFNVVARPTRIDTDAWDYVSQFGTNDQVIALLNRENVNALDLERIAFRMRDRAFFESVIQLLQGRHVYQPTLWSFALFHNDVPAARQYLLHSDQIVGEAGGPLQSPLLTIDPVARHQYEHLEYKPLVNARAHPLGKRRQIVNQVLLEQYQRFLKTLSYKQHLGDDDLLAVTYYLLLQDRIDEALTTFGQVNPEKISTRIQYDYCHAYLDLFSDDPLKARAIAAPYVNYPVDRWRNAFAAIVNYLNEVDGQGAKVIDEEDRTQRQGQLASKEAAFDFNLDNKAIQLTWQNLDAVQVNYYLMDVELLFSRNPFVQQGGSQFTAIKPNLSQEVKLPKDQTRMAIPLPEDLAKRNVLVELSAKGKTRSLPYYANAMTIKLSENFGQLSVADATSARPLSKVYVKTYVRLANGQVKFHKDGYTDLRGRFDYSSVSTPESVPPERFAILVLSDHHGAQIREAAPPPR